MPSAIQTIEFEGYFAEGVLGIFKIIRGFANLRDLAAVSVPYELSDGAEAGLVDAGGGPHDLVLVPDVPGIPDVVRGHGFVTNFGEHTVGVIDLRETSPNYHQMIGRIGWPEEMQQ